MRTTVKIDDDLLRAVKLRAASSGSTMSQVIEDAIRRELLRPSEAPSRARPLPVFRGRRGLRPGVDLTDASALFDLMDEGRPVDARR